MDSNVEQNSRADGAADGFSDNNNCIDNRQLEVVKLPKHVMMSVVSSAVTRAEESFSTEKSKST